PSQRGLPKSLPVNTEIFVDCRVDWKLYYIHIVKFETFTGVSNEGILLKIGRHSRLIIICVSEVIFLYILVNLIYFPGPAFLHFFAIVVNGFFSMFLGWIALWFTSLGILFLVVSLLRKQNRILSLAIIIMPIINIVTVYSSTNRFLDFSREYAIIEATPITESLEKYYLDNLAYPDSLQQLVPEYIAEIPTPGIIGISEFEYIGHGDRFRLMFFQSTLSLEDVEKVEYNPWEKIKYNKSTSVDGWQYY
ncbi:MAG: hypothetical protein V3W18_11605, partial [candidate division Zixibacteria bacterium]